MKAKEYKLYKEEVIDTLLFRLEIPKEFVRFEKYNSLAIGALRKWLLEKLGVVDLIDLVPSACGWWDLKISHYNWDKYRFELLEDNENYFLSVYEYVGSRQGFYVDEAPVCDPEN